MNNTKWNKMEKAVLVSVDFKNNKVSYDFFEGENSYMEAWNFREGIQDDFDDNWRFRIIKLNAETAVLDQPNQH